MRAELKIDTKTGLKLFNSNFVNGLPEDHHAYTIIKKDWEGTAIDILKDDSIQYKSKMFIVLREEICSEKLLRLASIYFYKNTLNVVDYTSSVVFIETAKKRVNNCITNEDLLKVRKLASTLVTQLRSIPYTNGGKDVVYKNTMTYVSFEVAERMLDLDASVAARESALLAILVVSKPKTVFEYSIKKSEIKQVFINYLIEAITNEGLERINSK